MTRGLSRRRFLTITAAAAGFSLAAPALAHAATGSALHRWRGSALGAQASILLNHPDTDAAQRLISACVDEIARLEKVFSLHRADSAISRLNRDGVLEAPPFELVQLLGDCRRFSRITDGAFDATVQPLWRLYAEHFSREGADPAGPDPAALSLVRGFVDHRAVTVDPTRISFARRGMSITLNGIAQGFITDRVAYLLRANGVDRVLVDLGEVRALGGHPSGRAWQIGIRDSQTPDMVTNTVALTDRAVATSAPGATLFVESGQHHHLFDPKTGASANRISSVSVLAPDATTADALSTAFAVLPESGVQKVVGKRPDIAVLLTRADGKTVTL